MGSKSANSKSKSKSNGKQKNGKVKLRKKDNIWVRIVKAFVGDKVSEQMEKHEPDHPTLCYNAEKQRWEKRPKPHWLPSEDWELLKHIRKNAHWMDYGCSCCCDSVVIGRSAVISLVPAVGPIVCIVLGSRMVNSKARKFDLPWSTTAMMYFRTGASECIGLVPVVGEVFVAWYKASTRNLYALEEVLEERYADRQYRDRVEYD
ncbi:hypothetical protein PNOK_0835500 [Pyrrhoderma noxium]|uniref:Uncharacterized protein n=1 Tax=Pyrrhoderma noxium TaxID=2282107 RepID=A0A286UB06_9AGAM|nr:hypothetical protein PNOK_0835500 [Pyrrhoderma noxium]